MQNPKRPMFTAVVGWRPASQVKTGKRPPGRRRSTERQEVEVADLWAEVPLGPWRVAYRAGLDGRRVVISEIRIYPGEAGQPPGRWSADELGALAPTPAGGITARLLRQINVGKHAAAISQFRTEDVARLLDRGHVVPKARAIHVSPRRSTRGRPPLPDSFYLELAKRYSALCGAGETAPIVTIARERSLPASSIRSAIARCRQRGLVD